MNELRFRTGDLPPGGIQFWQPEIRWRAPMPLSEGVDVLSYRVRELRKLNPVLSKLHLPLGLETIRREIIEFNCARNPSWCYEAGQAVAVESLVPHGTTSPVRSCCGGPR